MKSRPTFLRAMRLRNTATPLMMARPILVSPPVAFRAISTSPRLLNEAKPNADANADGKDGKDGKAGKEKEKAKPRFEENAAPQSPWKVFVQTLREEIDKTQGFADNVKQLQGEVDKAADSEAMRKARALYEKTRITTMIKENPRIAEAVRNLQTAGISVSDATARALQDSGVTDALERLTNMGRRFALPIKESTVGQAIIEALDDLGLQGYEGKEERRARRKKRVERSGVVRVKPNTEAGEALVLSKEQQSDSSSSRMSFLQNSPAYQRFMENYYESDDPLYSALRSVGTRVGRLFDENEQAKVIRAIRETDPHFRMDRFQTELKEYIVPEVIDAFLTADRGDMKAWMSEAAFNVSWAVLGEYIKSGLVSASQVIEVQSVDVLQAKFHNETVPVFLATCESQEVHAWKSAKTGEVKVGDTKSVKRSRYVFALTMVESELENELTSGWKVVEFVRREM